ncbi:Glutathione S-transferase, partial [Metarhizium brunneum ARSEF 3297]
MAAPGSRPEEGAGLPGMGQFRLDIGVGIDGDADPDDDYRPSPDASSGRAPAQGQHGAAAGGQFGILAPPTMLSGAMEGHGDGARHVSFAADSHETQRKRPGKIVVDPPDLRAWREKLFNVDSMIVLTDEQFETYFPHVDNVYSHRSTQRYKRKPFVSHYWDCRMKGRPPGTPKSDDPSKKKRKRSARERDLCDVKIRITEYFPNASAYVDREAAEAVAAAGAALPAGQRFWTIQRVNGNGGNGKGDGVAGPHRHTLETSDEIKKNSVQRHVAKQEKQARQMQKGRAPLRKATGTAATLVKKHAKEHDLKLYSSCFWYVRPLAQVVPVEQNSLSWRSPFSQRVWIALEAKGLSYQYCETDPSKAPPAAPSETVPAIRHDDWSCSENAVILEYLEDVDARTPLLPSDPKLKARCRLWIDHVNFRIVPAFYDLLFSRDPPSRSESTRRLQRHIASLVIAADEQGPFFTGSALSLVDIHFAPFALRLSRILRPLKGWTDPMPGTRWNRWLDSLERNVHVKATTSLDDLYVSTVGLLAWRAQ